MNCDTARRLLDRGMEPGSVTPARTQLGFHLAQCAACRAYQQQSQHHLLAALLGEPAHVAVPTPPAPVVPASVVAQRPVRPPRRSRYPWRLIGVGVAAVALVALLLVVAPAVGALFRIQQNVQAMQIATPTLLQATPELAPVLAVVPTATALTVTGAPVVAASAAPSMPTLAVASASPSATARVLPTQTITPVPLDAILAVGAAVTPVSAASLSAFESAPSKTGAITVLLVGVDRRPGESGGTRADTVIIARIDPKNERLAMLSLPRDLVVPIPGYGYYRINAASAFGGIDLTRETVSNLLGMPIDYVAQIDFQGFTGAVDAIGGVDIDVPTEIYDPEYPTMDYGYTVAHFLPGPQHMDGERALMYARTRHADSDFSRMRRQQAVLVGVLQRVRQQNMVQQLQSIADVTTALRGYIQTDLPEDMMISLAWTFRSFAPDRVERYTLSENDIQIGAIPGDYYALVAVPGAIDQLANQLVYGTRQ